MLLTVIKDVPLLCAQDQASQNPTIPYHLEAVRTRQLLGEGEPSFVDESALVGFHCADDSIPVNIRSTLTGVSFKKIK